MKVMLEKEKPISYNDNATARWIESEPFVMNSRGHLVHRPRMVTSRKNKAPYISIHYFCGQSVTGNKKFTFLDMPPEGSLVCHACESRAVMAGHKSAAEIAGRHVCVGRMKPFNICPIHGTPEAP